MILWTIKLINSVRKAIAGRKHPSQLAWGVAFGALVGLIPHGNLLAVVLVLLVLMLKVNHAMVALVGVGITFFAPQLDPTFDAFGRWVFEQPHVAEKMAIAWQYPLVPWTDLNNTVVMGSFLIGLSSLVPLYVMSNRLFRVWAPADEVAEGDLKPAAKTKRQARKDKPRKDERGDQPVHRIDTNHAAASQPHVLTKKNNPAGLPVLPGNNATLSVAASGRVYDVRRIDAGVTENGDEATNAASLEKAAAHGDRASGGSISRDLVSDDSVSGSSGDQPQPPPPLAPAPHPPRPTRVAIAVEATPPKPKSTRAALVSKSTSIQNDPKNKVDAYDSFADDQHKIDEALSYLLRQLRDSQDKDAA